MPWAKTQSETAADLTQADLLRKESTWYSSYPESKPWIDSLEAAHYKLISEYELDSGTLLRFELDEKFRGELAPNSSHFQNVFISHKAKEPELGPAMVVEKCPTCRKPI